jgi:multicomponent Na+:H+ antiporter subunit A
VAWRPFFGRARETPRHAHEAPASLWLGPVLLAALSVALGLLPDVLAVPLVQPAASAMRGEHTEIVLQPWAGMSPAFAQSLLMLALGAALYAVHDRALGWLAPLGKLAAWGPGRAYQALLAGIIVVAKGQTRVLQNGVLGWYLLVTIGTTVFLGGYALATRVGPVPIGLDPVRLDEAAVALAMVAGAVALVRARSLLLAVAALGVVGYGIALVFLLFGGPDLALTQFAIETLSVLLFVLVLRRLPPMRVLSPRSERIRDGVVALAGGVFMTALTLAAIAAPHPGVLREYFAATSLALANGRNVVNVILVDFRGFDTLGEITVLAVAAIGVLALLRLRPGAGGEEAR